MLLNRSARPVASERLQTPLFFPISLFVLDRSNADLYSQGINNA